MLDRNSIRKLFGQKEDADSRDLEAMRDIADDVIEADFVPYACLFDPFTLATKNGELLQIIRLSADDVQAQQTQNLRDIFRQSIAQKIPNTNYALWLHTIRRRRPLVPPFPQDNAFSNALDKEWRQANNVDDSYFNEIYVTIVRAGEPVGSEAEPRKAFLRSLWPPLDLRVRSRFMDEAAAELNQTVQSIMADLEKYGAHRLGLVEREDGVIYGEHFEFLEKLINLEARPMPVVDEDLGEYLTSGDVTFGFNAMEVRTSEGHRRFAAMLTIKEYKEASLGGLDQFLEIPCELIVTQCFDFVGAKNAREAYETQERYLHLSGDKELTAWSEIDTLTRDVGLGERAFGRQQTGLFMIAPNLRQLEANIKMVRRALTRLGIVTVREDLRFEEMYWAQLPANFTFIARSYSVNTAHLGGFVKIERPPLGNPFGTHWGPPLTVFRNAQGQAKFFSFHDQPSPHVAIVAQHGKGRTSFAHALVAQTRKYPGARLWVVDTRGRSAAIIEAMGGQYVTLGAGAGINPFMQINDDASQEFLALWGASLLDASGRAHTPEVLQFMRFVATQVLASPKRDFANFVAMLAREDAMLSKNMQPWLEQPLLNAAQDALALTPCFGVNIAAVLQDETLRVAVCSYILHRMTMALDGTPTVIVLDEAFLQLSNPLFGPRIEGWMGYLAQQNAVLVGLTGEPLAALSAGTVPPFMAACGHKFFFPDEDPIPELIGAYGLSEEGYSVLPEIAGKQRFVLHQEMGGQMSLYRNPSVAQHSTQEILRGIRAPVAKKSAGDVLAELMGTPASEVLA